MKFKRALDLIAKYGFLAGTRIYLHIKNKGLSKLKVPGIREPIVLRQNTSDVAIFEQVFLKGDYDVDFKFQPRIIVDAGAHIGLFSVLMANRFPEARIICIEPAKHNYEMLRTNLAGYAGIEIMNAGLWSSTTKLEVTDRYHAGPSALTVGENLGHGSVPGVTVKSMMEKYGLKSIDILKIDIETSERELFAKNYEDWMPMVRMIIIELHDWLQPGCSRVFFEAINKSYPNYSYSICGENTIIEHRDFEC